MSVADIISLLVCLPLLSFCVCVCVCAACVCLNDLALVLSSLKRLRSAHTYCKVTLMSNACIWGRQARSEARTSTTEWKGAGLIPVTDRPVVIAEVPLSKALHSAASGARTLQQWSKYSERIFQTWFYIKWSVLLNKLVNRVFSASALPSNHVTITLPWGS